MYLVTRSRAHMPSKNFKFLSFLSLCVSLSCLLLYALINSENKMQKENPSRPITHFLLHLRSPRSTQGWRSFKQKISKSSYFCHCAFVYVYEYIYRTRLCIEVYIFNCVCVYYLLSNCSCESFWFFYVQFCMVGAEWVNTSMFEHGWVCVVNSLQFSLCLSISVTHPSPRLIKHLFCFCLKSKMHNGVSSIFHHYCLPQLHHMYGHFYLFYFYEKKKNQMNVIKTKIM